MMFFEIRVPQDPAGREQFENAWRKAAFAASDYREEIIALNAPSSLRTGQKLDVHLKVKNLGAETWPAAGTNDFRYLIDLGNRWIRGTENKEDNRAVLKADLPPGGETWPAAGTKDFRYLIDLGNRWIRGTENKEDNRAVLKADLPPGGETELTMTITAPSQPGDYTLEFDMVHEAVVWFKQRGARPLSIKVTVTP
jgi:hypothetical protein